MTLNEGLVWMGEPVYEFTRTSSTIMTCNTAVRVVS